MQLGLALLGAAAAMAVVVTWVNERHDRKKAAAGPTPDDRIDAAWAEFGIGEDPDDARDTLDALLDSIDPATLQRKSSVVALAVMAARGERYEPLTALATRARSLDGGCGETAALAVLAELRGGDVARAREMYLASQAQMAGCASCSAAGPGKYLMQEVAILLDALEPAPAPR